MIRKVPVEVKDSKQAAAIETALKNDEIKAFVITCGVLLPLESTDRIKVLRCVSILHDIPLL